MVRRRAGGVGGGGVMRSNEITIGLVFGRLTVLGVSIESPNSNKRVWRCQCVCGKLHAASGKALAHSNVRSCGCWKAQLDKARACRSWYHTGKFRDHYSPEDLP